jgi:hypothetical protein
MQKMAAPPLWRRGNNQYHQQYITYILMRSSYEPAVLCLAE